ncbi:MAG TPA: DUF305 domain-containing protein [Longimicrobium sp.]|nr:DUF305 domain-containing protein [Longimicrobium sp.]
MKSLLQWMAGTAVLLLVTAGCGAATAQVQPSAPPPGARPSVAPPAARADTGGAPRHNAADVAFMRGMMAHHAQALEMTALVPTHTENTQIQLLARRIDVSQQDEIATIRRWLQDRGEAVPAAGAHAGHDMAGMQHDMPGMQHDTSAMEHARMPGMLSPEEMARLRAATGVEFDALFLQLMIRHHEGALTMVEQLLAAPGAAQQPDTFGFANDVDADQRAEIARMQRLLAAISPAARP